MSCMTKLPFSVSASHHVTSVPTISQPAESAWPRIAAPRVFVVGPIQLQGTSLLLLVGSQEALSKARQATTFIPTFPPSPITKANTSLSRIDQF